MFAHDFDVELPLGGFSGSLGELEGEDALPGGHEVDLVEGEAFELVLELLGRREQPQHGEALRNE